MTATVPSVSLLGETSPVNEQPRLGLPAIDMSSQAVTDRAFWSVTTIIGSLDKPALLYWSAEQTAVAAIGSEATWRGLIADCNDGCTHDSAVDCQAVKWLRDARFRRPHNRLTAAELGTVVHALCETYALTGVRPSRDDMASKIRDAGGAGVVVDRELDPVTAMLDRFDDWLGRFTPSYQATEVTVFNPTAGYAGTTDAFLSIDGVRFIADYKTSRRPLERRPYPEVALQLAAYRHAELAAVWRPRRTEKFRRRYYLLSAAEQEMAVPVPEVDGGLVIHITPDGCEAFPVDCGPDQFRSFRHVQQAARWSFELSKGVIGEPLEAPTGQEAL